MRVAPAGNSRANLVIKKRLVSLKEHRLTTIIASGQTHNKKTGKDDFYERDFEEGFIIFDFSGG